MQEQFDERTLRAFPYVIFTMMISIMISMLSPIVQLFSGDGVSSDVNLYQMNTNLYMMCYVIAYLAIVWILSCLYHLSPMTKWFNYSYVMTIAYIISESVCYILKWLSGLFADLFVFNILYNISRYVPTVCIMMMLVFILHGAAVLYLEMDKKKKSIECKKLEVYWIAAFASQILLNIVISTDTGNTVYSPLYAILTSSIYIYNIVLMVMMYISVKSFCYEYYLYSYNSRIR